MSPNFRLEPFLLDRRQAKPRALRGPRRLLAVSLCGLLAACSALDRSGTDGESSFVTAGGRIRTEAVASSEDVSSESSDATGPEVRPAQASTGETDAGPLLTFVGEWANSLAPESCVKDLSNPIDGCDPQQNPTWDLDCDEDGVPDHFAYECDPGNTERGPAFLGPYDCAPEDPRLAIWVAPDSDDDGIPGSGEFNCSSQDIPSGYVPIQDDSLQDCDDSAAGVHPGAPEVWGDSIDADCSGSDYPNCDVLENGGPIEAIVIPGSVCQAGVDLQLMEPARCSEKCGTTGTLYFLVVNAGTEDSDAEVNIAWSDDTGASGETILPAIAAGGASALVPMSFKYANELRVKVEDEDCDPTNNARVIPAVGEQPCLF